MQAEIGRQVPGIGLGNHFAVPVGAETVNLHPIVAGETADFLGKETRSMEALQSVIAAGKRRPWNSQPLRARALAAAEAIAAKMGKRLNENGDVV